MKREEKQRQLGRRARRIRGKGIKAPVLRAITTNEEGESIELNSHSTMVPVIAESNRVRQRQCSGTPFLIPPLLNEFGYLAKEETAQQVKNGTYVPPEGIDAIIVDFLNALKMPDKIREQGDISLCVTPEENTQGWEKMKDKTAGASGVPGFTHYKIASQFQDLNEIETFLANAPLLLGNIPKGWMTATDLQILKRINDPHVGSMRTIQLFCPEFNMRNKTLGKRVLYNAEKANAVEDDQYGSRKKHKAINADLNKVLTMDTLRQRRWAGAIASVDAKGCYDRIIHTIAILVLMAFGLISSQARVLMAVLQQCKHRIKTKMCLRCACINFKICN